jgi:hypothetical protein
MDMKSKKNLKIKFLIIFIFIIGFLTGLYLLVRVINSWFNTHTIQFNQVISITVKPPFEIKKREVKIKQVVNVLDKIKEPETTLEKYVFDKWGAENYKLAIAIFTAESGLREDAYNINSNGTVDYGIAQINSVNWKIKGCSLKEIAFWKGNIDCAYKLWDRANGREGDGKGSWTPWTAAKNGAYLEFLK